MRHPSFITEAAGDIVAAVNVLQHQKSPSFYRLQRGRDLLDALLEPVFYELKAKLPTCPDDLLAVALLLASRATGNASLMKALAADNLSRSPRANDTRVARFVKSSRPEEVFTQIHRFLMQCKGAVSPFDVAAVVLRWRPSMIEGLRKDLLSDYFTGYPAK